MAASVKFSGLTITRINPLGAVPQAQYDGEVTFKVSSGTTISFDYTYKFTRVGDVEDAVTNGAKNLRSELDLLAVAAQSVKY